MRLMDPLIRVDGVGFYLIADLLIAMLTLMMAAVAECITIPTGMAQLADGLPAARDRAAHGAQPEVVAE